jgi:hypothetical protein
VCDTSENAKQHSDTNHLTTTAVATDATMPGAPPPPPPTPTDAEDSDDDDVVWGGLFDDGVYDYVEVAPSKAEVATQAWELKVEQKVKGAKDQEHQKFIEAALTANGFRLRVLNLHDRLRDHTIERKQAESLLRAMFHALEFDPDFPTDFQRDWYGDAMINELVKIKNRFGKAEMVEIPGPPLQGGYSYLRGEKLFQGITFKKWAWHFFDEPFSF